jgi:HicB family
MATARAERTKTPDANGSHSGKLLLRMPPTLHAELARAAEREGTSLNAHIIRSLSDAAHGARSEPERPSGGRLLRYAIIADLVLVAVAAVVAVALLIAAWP